MSDILWIFAALAVAVAFGLLAWKLRVPTGGMIGAMVGVALFCIVVRPTPLPNWMRITMQAFSGILIGSRIKREALHAMLKLPVAALTLVLGLIAFNLAVGLLSYKVSGLALGTALFGACPGGIADISLMAADYGADTATVSVLQMCRLFSVILFLPPIFKNLPRSPHAEERVSQQQQRSGYDFPLSLLAAGVGAAIGLLLRIPAGAMVGSMLGVAVLSVATGRATFPQAGKLPLQIASGAYIGSTVSLATVLAMTKLGVPLLLLIGSMFISTFVLGTLMHRLTRIDWRTCLLSSTPGGLMEMSLLADDLGADASTVGVLQTMRLFAVVLLFPPLLGLAVNFFG